MLSDTREKIGDWSETNAQPALSEDSVNTEDNERYFQPFQKLSKNEFVSLIVQVSDVITSHFATSSDVIERVNGETQKKIH